MFKVVNGNYRDEKAVELNKAIEKLIEKLELGLELTNDEMINRTIDPNTQKPMSYWEVVDISQNHQKLMRLDVEKGFLEEMVSELRDIVYSDYETRAVTLKSENTIKKPRDYMSDGELLRWLGTFVKPLILEGETKQVTLAERFGIDASTLSRRVSRAYDVDWREYVAYVKQGIF